MPRYRLLTHLVSLALVAGACAPSPQARLAASSLPRESNPDVSRDLMLELARSNNSFALDLYQLLHDEPENLVYSPYSLSMALAMTFAGARTETAAQMAAAMHFDLPQEQLHPAFNLLDLSLAQASKPTSEEEQPLQLSVANAIWTDEGLTLLTDYLDVLASNYGAGVHRADFLNSPEPARREINDWVSGQTEQRIEELIAEGALDPSTLMVLVNAIYFNGDWLHPFEADKTRELLFHRLDGTEVTVEMMHNHLSSALYAATAGAQFVELPYQGGSAAMDIIIPDEGNFETFATALDSATLDAILVDAQPTSLDLGLPKFSFASAFDLSERLSALGMPDAFDRDLADFSGITGGRDLFIDKVVHQALVAVDEKGTEAAAATAVIMAPTGALMPQLQLIVDRPFIFTIRELGTGQILFMGQVLDPSQE